jgi:hypothetical protein
MASLGESSCVSLAKKKTLKITQELSLNSADSWPCGLSFVNSVTATRAAWSAVSVAAAEFSAAPHT